VAWTPPRFTITTVDGIDATAIPGKTGPRRLTYFLYIYSVNAIKHQQLKMTICFYVHV